MVRVMIMNSFGVVVRVYRVGIMVYVKLFVRLQNHKKQSHVKIWASDLVRATSYFVPRTNISKRKRGAPLLRRNLNE